MSCFVRINVDVKANRMVRLKLPTFTLIQPSLKFLKGNMSFFTQLTLLTGSFAPFGKFLLGNIHSAFSGVHPAVCFCVRLMDFVIFMLFCKGVDGTDFLAGFAAGGVNAFTVLAVRSAGRGSVLGNAPYGYDRVKNDNGYQLVIDETAAEIVRRIFQMAKGSMSLRAIAEALTRDGVRTPEGYRTTQLVHADGIYTYNDMDDLIDVCVKNMVNDQFTEEQARSYMQELLPKLDYWKRYEELSDNGQFEEFKMQLINEINDLHIDGLPRVDKLNALVGKYVNLEYTLPNGQKVKFLDDQKTYLGNQLESEFGGDRCFGILASMDFILVCTYEKDGENPELVIYKKR